MKYLLAFLLLTSCVYPKRECHTVCIPNEECKYTCKSPEEWNWDDYND